MLTEDKKRANELFDESLKLRDTSRDHWAKANEHLREMGSAINKLNDVLVELSEVIKRIKK